MGQDYGTLDQCLEQEARLREESDKSSSNDGEGYSSSSSTTSYVVSVKRHSLLLLFLIGIWKFLKGILFVIAALAIFAGICLGLLLLAWVTSELTIFAAKYVYPILIAMFSLFLAKIFIFDVMMSKIRSRKNTDGGIHVGRK